MLTERQIEIVKSTVPALRAHGEAITKTFYHNLFEENPQLKDVFNMANQAKGDQPRSLAASVLAYAANIDQLQNLGPAVSLIAHKHCSLDVAPEHYPIVGRNLLRAIGEVLGDAATPEIVDAWSAAYGQLAEIFIGVEGGMYADDAARGWAGFKPFRVAEKKRESETIASFTLVPEDGRPLPSHEAGQYLSIRFEGVFPNVEMRQYTISCCSNASSYRISVKREPGGLVSNHLHDNVSQGDTVLIHMPHGEFVLDEKAGTPVALISGGVGITPMMAMLERLIESGSDRPIAFIHATADGAVHAFGPRLREIAEAHPNVTPFIAYEFPRAEDVRGVHFDLHGRLSHGDLTELVDSTSDCYICGPKPFMKGIDESLQALGTPAGRRKREVFGPTLEIEEPAAI
jgi:nitric oxide dioxygenase